MPRYGPVEQSDALRLYEQGESLSAISRRRGMPSRETLNNWKKDGTPVEITGGVPWDEYVDARRKADAQATRDRAVISTEETTLTFLENAKNDVARLFEELRKRLATGEGEAKFADIEKLLNVYIRLDNSKANQLMWMQSVVRRLVQIVVRRVKDPNAVQLIQADLIALQEAEEKSLGEIAERENYSLPAEVVTVDAPLLSTSE